MTMYISLNTTAYRYEAKNYANAKDVEGALNRAAEVLMLVFDNSTAMWAYVVSVRKDTDD